MRRPFALLLALAAALCSPGAASATKYAGEFLKIPIGPRAIGMGGAFVGVADDATAGYWNPAGLVYLPYREAMFQHQERFGSLVNHDVVSAVFPLGGQPGRQMALGVSLLRLAIDDIPITPRPSGLRPQIDFLDYGRDNDDSTPLDGQGNGRWDVGERLLITPDDLFYASSSDMAVYASFGRHHGTHWAYGGNLKFVRQSLPDTLRGQNVTSFGAGFDLGAVYMPTDAVTIGATLRDVTTTYLAWSNGTRELIAPSLDTGAGFNFKPAERHALTWAIDLAWGFERRKLDSQIKVGGQTWDIRTGLEYWYRNTLALRSGLNGKDLTFGAGIRYKHFGADYAASLNRFFAASDPQFPDDEELDATHLVSLTYNW